MSNIILILFCCVFSINVWAQPETMSLNSSAQSRELSSDRANNENLEDKHLTYKPPISDGRYLAGGLVGTFLGFGLGHGVNGTFKNRGLVIAVGQLTSLAATIVWAEKTETVTASGTRTKKSHSMAILGTFGYVGFRIWEIFDVWWTPAKMNREHYAKHKKNKVSLGILPVKGGAHAMLGFQF